MFNIKTILAVATALVLGADAACYTSGQKGNQDYMRNEQRRIDICNQQIIKGRTWFNPGEGRSWCENQGSDNVRWNISFGKHNTAGAGADLTLQMCKDAIYAEANGCQYGGANVIGTYPKAFTVKVDPNTGRC